MKNLNFKIVAIVLGVLSLFFLSLMLLNIRNKSLLESEVLSLKDKISLKDTKIEELKIKADTSVIKEVSNPVSIKEVGGKIILKKINSKLVFPTNLAIPSISEDINNSHIQLGSKFSFTPSASWRFKLNGNALELYHPQEIEGIIKGIALEEKLEIKDLLKSFFEGYPTGTTIDMYKEIYISEKQAGMLACGKTVIDGKDTLITVGLIQKGEYGVQFVFLSDTKEISSELISLLLKSGMFVNYKIKIQ